MKLSKQEVFMGVSQLPDTSWLHTYMAPTDYVDVYAADLSARADLQACDIRQLGVTFRMWIWRG